jgi:hypothetical protein
MTGRVKARRWPLVAQSWATQGGRTWQDSAVVHPRSAGVGWERELIGRAHASTRGEREDTEDGRRESKKKMYSAESAKGTHGPMKGMMAYGRRGPARRPGLARLISIEKIQKGFDFRI